MIVTAIGILICFVGMLSLAGILARYVRDEIRRHRQGENQ